MVLRKKERERERDPSWITMQSKKERKFLPCFGNALEQKL